MVYSPVRSAISHAPRSKPTPDQPSVCDRPRGARRSHIAATVAEVRHLVETTLMTYAEIAQRTGVARGTIWHWSSHRKWMRPGFAPRWTHTVPAWRAGRQRRRRMLAVRLVTLAERMCARSRRHPPSMLPGCARRARFSRWQSWPRGRTPRAPAFSRRCVRWRTRKPRARVIADPSANGIGIARTPGKTVARNDRRDHRAAPDRAVDGMIEDVRQDGRPRPPHPAAIRREDVPLSPRK